MFPGTCVFCSNITQQNYTTCKKVSTFLQGYFASTPIQPIFSHFPSNFSLFLSPPWLFFRLPPKWFLCFNSHILEQVFLKCFFVNHSGWKFNQNLFSCFSFFLSKKIMPFLEMFLFFPLSLSPFFPFLSHHSFSFLYTQFCLPEISYFTLSRYSHGLNC